MEPRLNIKIAQIFEAAEMPVDPNFIGPDDQWVGDWIDRTEDYPENMQAYMEQREGIGEHLDRNVQTEGFSATPNPAQDYALMALEPEVVGTPDLAEIPGGAGASGTTLPRAASKLRKQANGFNNTQSRVDFTMGVVANASSGSLTNARVVVETPSTKIAGTVIAVGEQEFAVVWDDRTASVERKGDYELVFSE